jgi:hypothetical protein
MIPHIGSEMVEVLRARQISPEPAFPVLPTGLAGHHTEARPSSLPHMISSLRHSNALAAIIRIVILWLL